MSSMVNRFEGKCGVCGNTVPANGGFVTKAGRKWEVRHLACLSGKPGVMTIETSGGTFIRNRRGRCEDAPCCGCCSI